MDAGNCWYFTCRLLQPAAISPPIRLYHPYPGLTRAPYHPLIPHCPIHRRPFHLRPRRLLSYPALWPSFSFPHSPSILFLTSFSCLLFSYFWSNSFTSSFDLWIYSCYMTFPLQTPSSTFVIWSLILGPSSTNFIARFSTPFRVPLSLPSTHGLSLCLFERIFFVHVSTTPTSASVLTSLPLVVSVIYLLLSLVII